DWTTIGRFKRNRGTVRSVKNVQRVLLPQVSKKINQTAYASAAISVGLRSNIQKALVRIGGFLVPFSSRRGLAKIKNIIRLIRIERARTLKSTNRQVGSVFIEVDHGETADGYRFVGIQTESGAKFFY